MVCCRGEASGWHVCWMRVDSDPGKDVFDVRCDRCLPGTGPSLADGPLSLHFPWRESVQLKSDNK